MSFPPPPQPNQPQPGQGGGYGPPQNYGPPPPPQGGGGYGYPNQDGYPQQGGGYPPQDGGYGGGGPVGPVGPYGTPPGGGGGGNGGRIAAIVIGVVLLGALVLGGLVLALGSDDTRTTSSGSTPSPSETTSAPETSSPATDDATDDATASSAPTDSLVPYVVLSPGKCFDHPGLNSSVTVVTARSCTSLHDGEVIANETLTGSFTTESELKTKVLGLCEKDAKARLAKIPADGKTYYYYAIYPSLETYKIQDKDTISCALTLSNKLDGRQLTKPLP